MTKTHKIAVLPGDGIGPEITEQAMKALKAFEPILDCKFELEYAAIGGAGLEECNNPLPEKTLELVKRSDAVFLGAVGDWKYDTYPPELRPEQGLLQVRKALGLYANLRPVKAYKPLIGASTLKPEVVDGIDMMVVRELTGGLYFGTPKERQETEAWDTMRYTKMEIERIAHTAFKLAQSRRKQLCSVDKANVLKTSQLWRDVVIEVGQQYPDVELSHMYVDNAAMQLIRSPKQFDVLLTENTFGDILSDEASMLTGSLGMLGSASLGEGNIGMYEPSHGSAPKYAGLNKANPIATILSAGMMLEYSFGYAKAAQILDDAVLAVLNKDIRTYDIVSDGGAAPVGTSEMGDAIAAMITELAAVKA